MKYSVALDSEGRIICIQIKDDSYQYLYNGENFDDNVEIEVEEANEELILSCGFEEQVKENYTITYDANGGTGAPSSQIKKHGEDIYLSSTLPTRTNYVFVSWISEYSISYNPGDLYEENKDLILTALWKPIETNINNIKVLNIYPFEETNKNYLYQWLNTPIDKTGPKTYLNEYGIKLDSVSIDTFNSNYSTYLFKNDDVWNYDVIVFGFAENNNGKDLTKESSEYLKNYLKDKKPIIFGYDIFCTEVSEHANFISLTYFSLDKTVNVPIMPGYRYKDIPTTATAKIVNQDTNYTKYPFNFDDKVINIGRSTPTGGYPNRNNKKSVIIAKYLYSKDDSPLNYESLNSNTSSVYLFVNKKFAFISTIGDSINHEIEEDEKKLMINVIYNLYNS